MAYQAEASVACRNLAFPLEAFHNRASWAAASRSQASSAAACRTGNPVPSAEDSQASSALQAAGNQAAWTADMPVAALLGSVQLRLAAMAPQQPTAPGQATRLQPDFQLALSVLPVRLAALQSLPELQRSWSDGRQPVRWLSQRVALQSQTGRYLQQ